MIVNKHDLSEILGVSERSLTEWQKEGMPMTYDGDRGEANQYDTAKVIEWMIKRDVEKVQAESPKDRLSRLQADKVEIEIAEKLGKLVSVDQIEPAWHAMVASARSFLRSEPDRLAHLIEMTEGVDAKRDLISETIDEFLRKLAGYQVPTEFETADDAHAARHGENGSATENVSGRMGRDLSVSIV